jgi:N-glycosyltransferase
VSIGGSSTVRQALACGIPVIASPLEWDQLENAARLEWTGAGIRIMPDRCTPSQLRHAVEAVLYDDQFGTNAARIQRSFQLDRLAKSLDVLESAAGVVNQTAAEGE